MNINETITKSTFETRHAPSNRPARGARSSDCCCMPSTRFSWTLESRLRLSDDEKKDRLLIESEPALNGVMVGIEDDELLREVRWV